jgi:hypothetical protein
VLRILGCLLLPLLVCASPAAAQSAGQAATRSNRTLPAVVTTTPPKIDGDLSDPTWKSAAKAETFYEAFGGKTDVDQTEVWICYDAEAIYVAFHAHDSHPEGIVGREIRRDSNFQGDDLVVFALDPFRTRRDDDMDFFLVNPLGTHASYMAGGRATKTEWKGDWQSAAKRVADGWTAELRIPWQILQFPSKSEPVTMGLNFVRSQQRTKLRSFWSWIGTEGRDELAGDWTAVQAPKNAFKRQLSLLPFATTHYSLAGPRQFGLGFGRNGLLNTGLDARAVLTPDLTAVATLNPDFSTVEGAVEGIDFTRGERFVEDTRPFFLEGAEHFDVNATSGYGYGATFFSGRIPAFDAGAKLYGRLGTKDSLGILATGDLGDRRGDLVGHWARNLGPDSSAGGYVVGHALPGDDNAVVGINESITRGPWRIRSDFATSMGVASGGSAANAGVRWIRKRLRLNAAYTHVSPHFRAADGFIPFTGFKGPDMFAVYVAEWRKGPFRQLFANLFALNQTRTDGSFFRQQYGLQGQLTTRKDWGLRLGWDGGLFDSALLTGAPPGSGPLVKQRDSAYTVGLVRNVSNRFDRVGIDYTFGTRADEPIHYLAPFVNRRLGKWDVGLSSSILSHLENHSLHVLTFNREFDPYRAFGGRVLLRDGRISYFISYRLSGGKGLEMYLLLGDPTGDATVSRTALYTKFVFPVAL